MSNLTYFLWMEDSSKDMSPDEEMEDYLRTCCPLPTEEELSKMYEEAFPCNQ